MRIIAGSYGGRLIESPRSHRTHPMSEKARGALFNSLNDITAFSVLDAFAGSGAVGLEALSRGAAVVVAVDVDRHAHHTMLNNAAALSVQNYQAIRANVFSWLERNSEERFDLIVADPPYDQLHEKQLPLLTQLLAANGRLVLSWPSKQLVPELPGMKITKTAQHGDLQLVFYSQLD